MKKGLIFDMDGTLWDSAENVAKSWNIAMDECGYQREDLTKEDIMAVMGKTMDAIADIIFADCINEERKKLLDKCCTAENDYLREHGGELYPKLEETFIKLKEKYNLYIVSNCQAGYIEAFLDYYGFGKYIEDIECYGNNDKPKGDNIALLYERNNLDMAYYVGDIQGDYDATMKAVEILGARDISRILLGDNLKDNSKNIIAENNIADGLKGLGFIHAQYGFGKIDAEVPELTAFEKLPELLGL